MISGIHNLLGFLLRDSSKIPTHERPLNKTEYPDALDHDMQESDGASNQTPPGPLLNKWIEEAVRLPFGSAELRESTVA